MYGMWDWTIFSQKNLWVSMLDYKRRYFCIILTDKKKAEQILIEWAQEAA